MKNKITCDYNTELIRIELLKVAWMVLYFPDKIPALS